VLLKGTRKFLSVYFI